MTEALASDDPSKRSLADDPGFIASLSDLDRGIADGPAPPRTVAPVAPVASTPGARSAIPVAPGASGNAPRRLIDLFPPSATDGALTITVPPSVVRSPNTAPPALAAPIVAAPRRAIPLVDAPPRASPSPSRRVEPASAGGLTYETFYGLREQPFSLSCDPRFLYHSAAHDRAAQAMLDAIRRRDGVAILTGDMGVGKTMLCRAIMEQLDRRTLTSHVADPFVTAEALLKTVLVDFGVISAADVAAGKLAKAVRGDLHTALRDFLYSLVALQAFAVIIIDEAQSLSVDLLNEVRTLTAIGGDEQLLQIMLVGQPSLSATLLRSELRTTFQRVSVRATLGSLVADEIGGYVAHRLQVAGASPRVEFDDGATERLYTLSRGVPRLINLVCDRALAAGRAESASIIDEAFIERAAEELDLAPPTPRASGLRMAATAAVFALLVLVGAAAGAFVFRANVTAWLERWQARPSEPNQPRPRQDLPQPYTPAPAADPAPPTNSEL